MRNFALAAAVLLVSSACKVEHTAEAPGVSTDMCQIEAALDTAREHARSYSEIADNVPTPLTPEYQRALKRYNTAKSAGKHCRAANGRFVS